MANCIDEILVEGCPLVFPRLYCELIRNNINVHVTGKMGGDHQLTRYVMNFLLTPDADINDIPDIVYYDKVKGKWFSKYTSECSINCGKQGGSYTYSRNLANLIKHSIQLEILFDYLRLNSSASIEHTTLKDVNVS